jgi:hypothetical protein
VSNHTQRTQFAKRRVGVAATVAKILTKPSDITELSVLVAGFPYAGSFRKSFAFQATERWMSVRRLAMFVTLLTRRDNTFLEPHIIDTRQAAIFPLFLYLEPHTRDERIEESTSKSRFKCMTHPSVLRSDKS